MLRHKRAMATCRRSLSTGFTIIELLVSIAIIGLLVAVLIPAVQSTRGIACKAVCNNHLHQFGIAIQVFETTHREYPLMAGPYIPRLDGQSDFMGYSIHAQLLPQLDLSTIAIQLDYQTPVDGIHDARRSRTQVIARTISVFQCPSEGSEWGTSFRACTGFDPASSHGDDGGIFGRVRGTRAAQITDGTSQTAMMSEKLHGAGIPGRFDSRRDLWFSGIQPLLSAPQLRSLTADRMLTYCQASATPTASYPFAGYDWMIHGSEYTSYNHVAPPNSVIPDCSGIGALPDADGIAYGLAMTSAIGSFRASSLHPGGVSVLYADGSVRFVADSVDLSVWRASASINKQD